MKVGTSTSCNGDMKQSSSALAFTRKSSNFLDNIHVQNDSESATWQVAWPLAIKLTYLVTVYFRYDGIFPYLKRLENN